MSAHGHLDDDEEASPLLGRNDEHAPKPTLYDRALAVTQEPLTDLARLLLVACIVLLLLAATFIGLFAGAEHKLHKTPPEKEPVTSTTTLIQTQTQTATVTTTVHSEPTPTACFTPECIQLSSDILSSLDTSKDPCEDFYDFATGGWQRSHPLAADKSRWGSFQQLAQENKAIIRRLVQTSSEDDDSLSDADKESLAKIKTLYTSCTDEDAASDLGAEPLAQLVKTMRDILHGKDVGAMSSFAQQDNSVQAHFSAAGNAGKHPWTAALAYVHSRGVSALFDFGIEGDAGRDPDAMVPIFSQPELGLPSKEYYVGDELQDIYTDVLERLLLSLDDGEEKKLEDYQDKPTRKAHLWPPWPWPPWGDDGDKSENKTARAHRLAKTVYKFESDVAAASADLDIILQDPIATYNPVELSTLAHAVPQIDFPAYFASFAVRRFPGSTVILTYPPFVAELGDILRNTSRETLEAYLTVRVALHYAQYLAPETDAWQAWKTLDETLRGLKKGAVPERGEWCLEQVERQLGYSVGRFFVQEKFGGDSRTKAIQVIKDIIFAFKDSLKHLEWMDEKSAGRAAEKADALDVKVGYPLYPDTTSDRSIAAYYASLHLRNGTFFENVLNSIVLAEKVQWAQLGQRRDHRRWEMFASTVNAYYQPPANEIVFPAGILQSPFFSAKWPGYLRYGAFGQVAAHELTHAFDNSGRMFNQNGKLEEWWTNTTSAAFNERAACLSAQYSNYTIDDGKGNKVPINGNLTSGENIGDSGIIQAFRAWKAQFDDSLAAGDEYVLPGLNYTREQLFFIAFGRIWATVVRPATALQLVRTDPHSPNRYRVDGTVYNVPEFAKAFECKAGSKLAPPPEKQCLFW